MGFPRPRHAETGSRERSGPRMTGAIERFPGVWHHRRHLKYLRPIPASDAGEACPERVIEIDWIIASRPMWEDSLDRQEAGWDVTDLADGLIFAERTIG